MSEPPHCLSESNLSQAWARAFLAVMEPGVSEIAPLCVTIMRLDSGREVEDLSIRQTLDEALAMHDEFSCRTVANTIFPVGLWNIERGRENLFERYAKILPGIKKADSRNRNGTYFERLTSFGTENINQLEHVISTYASGNHRRSALQAVIFDPALDHTNQRQRGFPCLQHVSFTPFGDAKLAITGVYATQNLFEKAYGNYLGLYKLGRFMAHEFGLELSQLNCIANVARRSNDDVTKRSLEDLAVGLRTILESRG